MLSGCRTTERVRPFHFRCNQPSSPSSLQMEWQGIPIHGKQAHLYLSNLGSNIGKSSSNSPFPRSPAMSYGRCSESAQFLLARTKYRPSLAIICGTGLGTLGELLSDTEVVPYADIPHFPISTGHNHRQDLLLYFVGDRFSPMKDIISMCTVQGSCKNLKVTAAGLRCCSEG